MDWDRLRIFLTVADAGSFTHAGEILDLSQSAVSRQVSSLEESLGVKLFHRHARGLLLTEQGDTLLATVRDMASKINKTESILSESMDRPKGPLRVSTTVSFGAAWLAVRIGEFLEQYPEISLVLRFDDSEVDLGMREADVAVRLTPPRQSDLIQRHLVTFHFHLYASKSYIQRHGSPTRLADLGQHRLITYGEEAGRAPFEGVDWITTAGGNDFSSQVILRANNFMAINRAVAAGVGIGVLPDYLARDDENLVRILESFNPPEVPAYFVYPEELRNSRRIGVLRDFLLKKITEKNSF
ncbi:MAG: LysR family transcriptional regulator [Candidatus Pacebacteria bacterium]|nr:LysR family transcriptional regulator [Candidatus Paceibacterota bacterium]